MRQSGLQSDQSDFDHHRDLIKKTIEDRTGWNILWIGYKYQGWEGDRDAVLIKISSEDRDRSLGDPDTDEVLEQAADELAKITGSFVVEVYFPCIRCGSEPVPRSDNPDCGNLAGGVYSFGAPRNVYEECGEDEDHKNEEFLICSSCENSDYQQKDLNKPHECTRCESTFTRRERPMYHTRLEGGFWAGGTWETQEEEKLPGISADGPRDWYDRPFCQDCAVQEFEEYLAALVDKFEQWKVENGF